MCLVVGLREGDHLVTVNTLAVSQLTHEDVVRIIGSSSSILKLQIAEMNRTLARDSDSSSGEEYVKPRYSAYWSELNTLQDSVLTIHL